MAPLLTLLFTLSVTLFACEGNGGCLQKAEDSALFSGGSLSVALAKKSRLSYSPVPLSRFRKYDPFLGLGVEAVDHPFEFPYIFLSKSVKKLTAVTPQGVRAGEISKHQCGLDRLGRFSGDVGTYGVIGDSCCALEAIITPAGVIEKSYLEHFWKSENVLYGDAGIRLADTLQSRVVSVDPFLPENPFCIGDEIIAYDGKKLSERCSVEEAILFSVPGSQHKVTVRRDGKELVLNVRIAERLGGGLLGDTFLERLGLYLDAQLCIVKASSLSDNLELLKGDCLIQLNGADVVSMAEIRQKLLQGDNSLLFERRNFQFFIHIKSKDAKITQKK